MTDSDRALEALKRGMSTEIWGQRFYEEALGRTQDETGKRVFGTLVAEEGKHLEILQGQYVALTGGTTWVDVEEAIRLSEGVEPTAIFPDTTDAQRLIPEDASDEQALGMAMDFERRGYALYTEEAAAAASASERDVWEYLARAENEHYVFLDRTLEFLKTNGTWYFDERELPFFEG